jgi:O-antigen/teichoic acid export membrane protein
LFSAFSAFVVGIMMLSFLFKYPDDGTEVIRKRDILSYAAPVFLTMLGMSLLSYMDVFLVKHFFNEHDAGLYSATSIVGKAFLFFPGAIGMTMFPKVSQNFELKQGTKKMLFNSLMLTAGISLAGILFCFIFPKFVISLLFGNKFTGIEGIVRLFGAAILPLVLFNIVMNYCLAVHKYAFIYVMYGGILLYAVLLWLFHADFYQVISVLFSVNLLVLVFSLLTVLVGKKEAEHGV